MGAATGIHVAVIGASGLAEALQHSGRFEAVHRFQTTSQFRNGIAGLASLPPERLTFLFADNTPNDLENTTIGDLVGRLTIKNYRVAVIECSPHGRAIVTQHPGAGLIPSPVTLNIVLGALSDRGVGMIEPVGEAWAYATLDVTNPAAVDIVKNASGEAPVEPFGDVFTPSTTAPFATEPQAAPAVSWGEQPTAPAAPTSVSPMWGEQPTAPAAPTPAPAQTWGAQPATATPWDGQAQAMPAAPWGAQPAPAAHVPEQTWGEQPTAPATWDGQAQAMTAAPWGAQPTAPAPEQAWEAQPTAPATWDGQAQAMPAAPWGAQPAAAAPVWAEQGGQPREATPQGGFAPEATTWSPQATWPQQAAATPAPTAWTEHGTAPTWQQAPAQGSGWPQQAVPAAAPGPYAMPTSPRKGYVISVAVAKGGAGKSSLTLNLGVWLGLRLRATGGNVCIVDANWQQADIGKQINAYNPTIYGLSQHREDLRPDRIAGHLYTRQDLGNTSFLLGPVRTEEANPLWITPKLYSDAVETLRHIFDYIIIDTPVAELHHDLFDDFVLPQSDYIVVPVIPNWPTIINTDNWLRQITLPVNQGGKGFDERRVGIILNRADSEIGFDEHDVETELGSWDYLGAIPNSNVWTRAGIENEIVATRNYPEINNAFGPILHLITKEDVLLEGLGEQNTRTPKKKWPWKR